MNSMPSSATHVKRKKAIAFAIFKLLFVLTFYNSAKGEVAAEDYCAKDETTEACGQTSNWIPENFAVVTVGTEKTHGYLRYIRSANVYEIPVTTLGLDEKWKGGNMNHPGGGQKINLLKKELEKLSKEEDSKDKIILFTDSYDVIFLNNIKNIIKKFLSFPDTKILFSAEQFCWPDTSLSTKYPETDAPNPYLNSGGFIGYLPELLEALSYKTVKDTDDDQLYYTRLYLDEKMRTKLQIKLDHKSEIFQNLNGAYSEVVLRANSTVEWPYLENTASNIIPMIVHGNGPSKITLNSIGSYLAKSWSPTHGCKYCDESRVTLDDDNLPIIMLAIFIEEPTPFMEEFYETIISLDYPKSKINLFVRNNVAYHEEDVDKFVKSNAQSYASIKTIKPSDFIEEAEARNIVLDRCVKTVCQYLFIVDSVARLKPEALRFLLSTGQDVVAPLLARPRMAWSNFWGAINAGGYYARSHDYMDIASSDIKGLWNVPFITNCYLVNAEIIKKHKEKITYEQSKLDPDMTFCASLRNLEVFMHVSNENELGHLVNPETFDIKVTNPEIYQLFENRLEWENRYLHPDYYNTLEDGYKPKMPCTDVFWFPLTTMRFCKEWIDIMEALGKWSDGTNNDNRLESGYEAVPTRDIHMTQVGLDRHWLQILQDYVRPLQELVFTGYYHEPPKSLMNFVVRYRPDEQPSLRPHHDSSTYTINLALNTPGIDYEGGGCRFIRYNCSVRDTKPGWLLMHPGRLTHYHEGLLVTKGTRYIMISFVDP